MRSNTRLLCDKYFTSIACELANALSFQYDRREAESKVFGLEGFCFEVKDGGFTPINKSILIKTDITGEINCLLGEIGNS